MRKLLKILAFLSILPLIACGRGGGNPGSSPQQIVSVSVNPPSGFTGFIGITQTLQFTAGITGTTNTGVTWAVNSIAGGNSSVGTMSSSGLYTAPGRVPMPQKVTVTATSQADSTRSASVFLTISRVPPTGSWQRTGPAGGTISVLAEDTSHPGTVYAGTDLGNLGALWKSADFGGTWTPIVTNTILDVSPAFDIAVPPSGGGTVIYICHGSFGLSQDGGATWADIHTPAFTRGMAVDPLNRQVIYLSAPGSGVLKSTDGGATWNLLANSPVIASGSATAILHNPITVDLTHESTVYYGTDHGMFVSPDAGVTWTQSTTGFAAGDSSVRDVAVDPANPAQVFALAGKPSSAVANLYQSGDRGVTWTLLSSNLDAERVVPDTVNANTIYLSGLQIHAVYKSTDAGHTFAPSDTGMPSGSSSGGGLLLGAATGTLLPLTARSGSFLSTIGAVGIFRSQDAAQSWTLSSSGTSSWQGFALAVDFLHPTTVYLAASAHIFKSVDNGATWTVLRNEGSLAIAVDPFASDHLLADFFGKGLFESQDGGTSWTQVTNLPSIPNGGSAQINAITFSPKVPGTIFIATTGNGNAGVLRSTDGGASYALANSGLTDFHVFAVAVNPQLLQCSSPGPVSGCSSQSITAIPGCSVLQNSEALSPLMPTARRPRSTSTGPNRPILALRGYPYRRE